METSPRICHHIIGINRLDFFDWAFCTGVLEFLFEKTKHATDPTAKADSVKLIKDNTVMDITATANKEVAITNRRYHSFT